MEEEVQIKFTIVLPTIWKSEYTKELLKRYSKSNYVGEIVLINNDHANTPDLSDIEKIVEVVEDENTYVNPAWNKGVSMAKYDYILISNDDVLFDVEELFFCLQYLESAYKIQKLGYIGMHSDNYKLLNSQDLKIEPYENVTNKGGWGCIFAFHKNNWTPIPERFKIWFGDNYLHMRHNIYQLKGLKITTKMSTSSDLKEVESVRDNDVIEWNKFLTGK